MSNALIFGIFLTKRFSVAGNCDFSNRLVLIIVRGRGAFHPGKGLFHAAGCSSNIITKYQAGSVFLSYFLWSGEIKAGASCLPEVLFHDQSREKSFTHSLTWRHTKKSRRGIPRLLCGKPNYGVWVKVTVTSGPTHTFVALPGVNV